MKPENEVEANVIKSVLKERGIYAEIKSFHDTAYDGLFRGIYEGSKQFQEMKNADKPPQPRKEAPTYEQYKQERQEILNEHESDQSQKTGTSQ
jgi:hypothetical protein